MIFDIRPLELDDYDTILVDWWKDWGWTPPTRDFLPDNGKGGMIVFDGDIKSPGAHLSESHLATLALEDLSQSRKDVIGDGLALEQQTSGESIKSDICGESKKAALGALADTG